MILLTDLWSLVCVFLCAAVDVYDDHVSPATAAQTLLCTAARKRKEVSPPSDRSLTPHSHSKETLRTSEKRIQI